jgi:hypothetical protein
MEIKKPSLHVDHMLRTTRLHHVQLSSMADMKANILLTMASVVITLSVRYILDPHLQWATFILILFCLSTIVLATYAVMPKTPFKLKQESHPDVTESRFNLLFFGDFVRLEYEDYESAMETVINDPNLTYQAMVRDLYTHGLFLAKEKYRFIRLAYITFITGAVASVLVGFFTNVLA